MDNVLPLTVAGVYGTARARMYLLIAAFCAAPGLHRLSSFLSSAGFSTGFRFPSLFCDIAQDHHQMDPLHRNVGNSFSPDFLLYRKYTLVTYEFDLLDVEFL